MGYCYPTGQLINGHWAFDKCDGRKSDCVIGELNKKCVEYCKTWSEAYGAMKILDKGDKNERNNKIKTETIQRK